ncbi:hypothetical protein AYI68_g1916 [Smittium mucronatum]|uniref:Uncharacterized protein n=1 Tax=Smittium mucronatum TaxID=133383 RepID=A0A1R0H477_9FUNG|nr:hypothetical protein AYI68_g1916 [Smittium mucronatum]
MYACANPNKNVMNIDTPNVTPNIKNIFFFPTTYWFDIFNGCSFSSSSTDTSPLLNPPYRVISSSKWSPSLSMPLLAPSSWYHLPPTPDVPVSHWPIDDRTFLFDFSLIGGSTLPDIILISINGSSLNTLWLVVCVSTHPVCTDLAHTITSGTISANNGNHINKSADK